MKNCLFVLLSAVLLVLSSCGKGNGLKRDLLNTVPAGTAYVCLLDVKAMSEKSGNEIKDGKMKWGAEARQILESFGPEGKKIMDFASENPGDVILEAAAVFEYNDNPVLTFKIKNQGKFIDYLKENGEKITETDNIKVGTDNRLAVKDKQVWMCGNGTLDALTIKELTSIKDKERFSDISYADAMINGGNDIDFFFNVEMLTSLGGKNGAMASMGMGFLLEQLTYIGGFVNFDEGEMKASMSFLNDKFEPAQTVLPMSGANGSALSAFPGAGNFFFMISLDKKTVSALLDQFGIFMGLDNSTRALLEGIDGPLVISSQLSSDGSPVSNSFMVTFSSPSKASEAQQTIGLLAGLQGGHSSGMELQTKGNAVLVSKGNQGGTPFSKFLSDFTGSYLGMAIDTDIISGANAELSRLVNNFVLVVKPEGNGMRLDLSAETEAGKNSLLSIIKFVQLVNDGVLNDHINKMNKAIAPVGGYDNIFEIEEVESIDTTMFEADPDDDVTIEELIQTDEVLEF